MGRRPAFLTPRGKNDFKYFSIRSNVTEMDCLSSNIDNLVSALYYPCFMLLQTVAYKDFKSRDFIYIFKTVMKILNSAFTVLILAELDWKHFYSVMNLH